MVRDDGVRRTAGGVFFYLMKGMVSPEQKRDIFRERIREKIRKKRLKKLLVKRMSNLTLN